MSFLDDSSGYYDDPGYYDTESDPYGIAQYMTPQFPIDYSTQQKNFGTPLPYSITTMGKQGNAMQDYYKILSDPVTQWLNMVTTGQQSLDTNALLQGSQAPEITNLMNSGDEYLQTIGQQLANNVPSAEIKTQLLTEPDIANDDRKMAIYNSAIDEGAKAQATQKATGPLAQFEKLGLKNPLETYTAENLPGDETLDPNMAAYMYNQSPDPSQEWQAWGNGQKLLADQLRNADPSRPRNGMVVPANQTRGPSSGMAWNGQGTNVGNNDPNNPQVQAMRQAVARKMGLNQSSADRSGPAPSGGGGTGATLQRLFTQVGNNARSGAAAQADRNAREAQQRQERNRTMFSRNADDFRRNVDTITAWKMGKQGRTPAQDQARSMLDWLRSQNYGG